MEYTTIKFESEDTGNWEILMAAKDPETLDVVKHSFATMEKGEGIIDIDPTDLKTLFYEKGTVFAECANAQDGDSMKETLVDMAIRLQKDSAKELHSALIFLQGDLAFLEAAEAATQVQEIIGDEADIIFGVSDDENLESISVVLVVV